MSIKLVRANKQYISAADSDSLTLSAGDYFITWDMVLDGLTTGDNTQCIFSNGGFSATGSLLVVYQTAGGGIPNGLRLYVEGNITSGSFVKALVPGSAYRCVLQKANGAITMRTCPILTSAPTDTSAVTQQFSVAYDGHALNGSGLFLGARADLDATRFCDQSLARFSLCSGTITDAEVAQLAYGKEVTALGRTPVWYSRMNDADDFANIGSTGTTNTFSKVNNPATGTAIAYGYVPTTTAPSIDGVPVIIGTPQTGSATSFTPAPATNSTGRTQQWYLDGVLVSGATNPTYTPLASDVGKSLTVKQTEGGTPSASATSAGVTVISAANTIDLDQVGAERVFQRSGASAAAPLTGAYTGTAPTSIDYQIYAADGATVIAPWASFPAPTISGGVWSGVASIPVGGPYRLAVRSNGGALATSNVKVNQFLAGATVLCYGSSSSNFLFTSDSGSGYVPAANVRVNRGGVWSKMSTDGVGTSMANSFASQLGVPIGMLGYGVGGTFLVDWANPSYSATKATTDAIAQNGGKIEAAIFTAGSNDATEKLISSRASHASKLKQVITNLRTFTGQNNLPFLLRGFNRRPGVDPNQANYARMGEVDAANDSTLPYVYLTQTLDFEVRPDNIHLTVAGFVQDGKRMQEVFGPVLVNGPTAYKSGPQINAFLVNGNTSAVKLTHRGGTDYTPTSGMTGFTAYDTSNTALNLVSAARTDTNTITLNWSGAPAKVKYMEGAAPDSSVTVYSNTTPALPMTVETDMPVTAVATLPTTPTITSVTVAPSTASVQGSATQQFSATVNGTNSPRQTVNWSASAGSISTSGLFTAPVATSSAQTITITATSSLDSNQKGFATVTVPAVVVTPSVSAVTVSPATVSLGGGGSQQFTASVTGTNNPSQGVLWSASAGTINSAGLFVAPAATNSVQVVTVTATSTLDTQKKGTAAVTVQALPQNPAPTGPVDFIPSVARTIKVRAGSLGFTGGPFWDMSNAFRPVGRMDPDSIIDITFDWSEVLDDIKSAIANVEFNLSGGLGTDKSVVGSKATVFVTRNGTGQISITSRMTTTSNPVRRMDATVLLKVEDL